MKTLVFRILACTLAALSLGQLNAQYSAEAGASSQDIIDLIEGTGLTAGLYHLQCTSGELNLLTRKLLLGE